MSKVVVIGHSHILALRGAAREAGADGGHDFEFLLLREPGLRAPPATGASEREHKGATSAVAGVDQAAVTARIAEFGADVAVLCINGNEHAGVGLIKSAAVPQADKIARVRTAVAQRLPVWLSFLLPHLPSRVLFYPSPPPVAATTLVGNFPKERISRFEGMDLEAPAFRLQLWQQQCDMTRQVCSRFGIGFVEPPTEAFDESGLLARPFWSSDPTHGNPSYGKLMLARLVEVIEEAPVAPTPARPRKTALPRHPYSQLPDSSFWRQSVSMVPPSDVDPVSEPPFRISRTDRVATAGSCFAQHISKRLRRSGYRYFVTEPGPADADGSGERGFYDFSARYGNLYTARQLVQLFDRAFGYYRPVDRIWRRDGGGFCDPFRPRIEPEGFATEDGLHRDRVRHLGAVRRMFRQLDVLVFTLGLTECWMSRLDGAVYPVAPGVVGGEFDPDKHVFANFSVREVVADLEAFIGRLQVVNPAARIILTVSPVPLVATAADRHVLVSTVYSKSVLRVAAEEVSRAHDHVCYFPSYEIITGPHAAGGYFEADRRSVTEAGVDHVMRIFMKHMTEQGADSQQAGASRPDTAASAAMAEMEALADAICDEEVLAR